MECINSISNINKNDKKIFIALSADYGNIGDIAITLAQETILHDIFPDRKIIEIPMFNVYDYEEAIKCILNDDDICTIIGGGNMGNIYLDFEEKRRFIIETFKNNKIISFPQSIDFENTDVGEKEFQTSIDIYGKHKNLIIFSREERSHNIMKNNFKNVVHLVPDIVFYLKNKLETNIKNRENITIILRNDKEKVLSDEIYNELIDLFNDKNIVISDTHIGEITISPNNRLNYFKETLDKFYASKFIITDRLHGMIFSIITNTPCIVFDNSNNKISSTYNTWLKNQPLIKFIENYNKEEILKYAMEFINLDNPEIKLDIEDNFEYLEKTLKEA